MKIHLYLLKRLILMVPTLFGITLVTFLILNLAPGGPIEQRLEKIRFGSATGSHSLSTRGNQGVSPEVIAALKKQYGFDKPLPVRYLIWLKKVVTLDFGDSSDYGRPAIEVIRSRFPVSLQFGITSFILTYLISVSVGVVMAAYANRGVDQGLSFTLIVMSAIPPFAFGVLLLVFFAGGTFFDWFPLGYLVSEGYEKLSPLGKIADRIHHFVLPLLAYMIGSFTTLAFLSRNSVLGEIQQDYIRTARAIGVGRWRLIGRHALRNALIPIVTGIGGFLGVFLSGSLLVESIFQLKGVGLLGFQALLSRDTNVIMALTFLQSVALLAGNLIGDLVYVFVDPRVDFSGATQ